MSYEQKYLKYKMKYLELKHQLGAGKGGKKFREPTQAEIDAAAIREAEFAQKLARQQARIDKEAAAELVKTDQARIKRESANAALQKRVAMPEPVSVASTPFLPIFRVPEQLPPTSREITQVRAANKIFIDVVSSSRTDSGSQGGKSSGSDQGVKTIVKFGVNGNLKTKEELKLISEQLQRVFSMFNVNLKKPITKHPYYAISITGDVSNDLSAYLQGNFGYTLDDIVVSNNTSVASRRANESYYEQPGAKNSAARVIKDSL